MLPQHLPVLWKMQSELNLFLDKQGGYILIGRRNYLKVYCLLILESAPNVSKTNTGIMEDLEFYVNRRFTSKMKQTTKSLFTEFIKFNSLLVFWSQVLQVERMKVSWDHLDCIFFTCMCMYAKWNIKTP